jgi:DNA repair protein RecN (Recombination protein N)
VSKVLTLLHIENIAVIEQADVWFGEGFNVLTGETGAGKSIVVDAINMVIGERASRDLIRTGAKSALATAVFQDVPPLPWLEQNGVQPDEDGNLILTRELHKDGRSLCRVGGRPVPVSALRALGGQLLNIHGQQDGQQLLNEGRHLSYLDRFAADGAEQKAYQAAYQRLAALKKEMDALRMDEAEKSRKVDTLRYQIEELERANLQDGEEEALRARRTLLRGAGKFMEALEQSGQCLVGDEDSAGALVLLEEAARALRTAASVSQELESLSGRMDETVYAVRDMAEEVRDLRYQFDFSPGELDALEGRLDLLYRLGRKYGADTKEMLSYLEESKKELERIELADDTLTRLEQQMDQALEDAVQAARRLSAARKRAAGALEERITAELTHLNMQGVRLKVEFTPKNALYGLDETGMDQVRFLLSANAGEDLRPIHKIASGGELARIMLAMKSVLAEDDDVGTLVFDEVDTGVSGRAASRVAEKLRSVSEKRQVLCVTHLPQIAAAGEIHFLVEKQEEKGRTFTAVHPLEAEERALEIARIVSGDQVTESSLQNAREMLSMWSKIKEKT